MHKHLLFYNNVYSTTASSSVIIHESTTHGHMAEKRPQADWADGCYMLHFIAMVVKNIVKQNDPEDSQTS